MGRVGAFPYALARLSTRHRSPVVAILIVTAATIAISFGLGFGYDPITAFGIVATALVILLVAAYIVTNLACIGYFLRAGRGEFNPVLHLIVPILGVLAFIPAWLTAAGLRAPGLSFITALSPPTSYAAPAVAIWMVLGVIYLIVLYTRNPQRVADVARVHLDEAPAAEPRVQEPA
jgi:amino acid transporter